MAIDKNKRQPIEKIKNLGQGLTFDDVLLVPNYSEVLPKNVITKTKLTKNTICEHCFRQSFSNYSFVGEKCMLGTQIKTHFRRGDYWKEVRCAGDQQGHLLPDLPKSQLFFFFPVREPKI